MPLRQKFVESICSLWGFLRSGILITTSLLCVPLMLGLCPWFHILESQFCSFSTVCILLFLNSQLSYSPQFNVFAFTSWALFKANTWNLMQSSSCLRGRSTSGLSSSSPSSASSGRCSRRRRSRRRRRRLLRAGGRCPQSRGGRPSRTSSRSRPRHARPCD